MSRVATTRLPSPRRPTRRRPRGDRRRLRRAHAGPVRDWGRLREERTSSAPSRANAASSEFPLLPGDLADVRRAVPNAILVTDVGWNKNGVGEYPVDTPDSFLTPGGFSTMGFGPSAVLGRRGRSTAGPRLLVGDGAFGSIRCRRNRCRDGNCPGLGRHEQRAFGTIAGLQRKHYGTRFGCEFEADGSSPSPDFAARAGLRQSASRSKKQINWNQRFGRLLVGKANGHRCTHAQHPRAHARGVDIERIYQAAQ